MRVGFDSLVYTSWIIFLNLSKSIVPWISLSFNSNAKILTDTEVENLVKLVDKYIDNAVLDIENAKFDINPKKLSTDKEEITGCKYCGYKDICFRRNENLVYLPKLDNTSFLESGVYE